MSAEEALRAGQLDIALSELQQQVRRHPDDPKLRVFLFQLLCVRGEWNRALTQLTVAGELDPGALLMVQMYSEALRCEVYRSEIFAGKAFITDSGETALLDVRSIEIGRDASRGDTAPGAV